MNRPFVTKKIFETNMLGAHGEHTHYCAQLISPEDASEVLSKQSVRAPVRDKTAGQWVLAGDVPQPMFSALESQSWHTCATDIRCLQSGYGQTYAAFTIQVGNNQSRFLMALFEPTVQRFFDSVLLGDKLTISIGKADSEAALLVPYPIRNSELFGVRKLTASSNFSDRQKALTELPRLLPFLGSLALIPSLIKRVVVKQVSVSLVHPDVPTDQRHCPAVRVTADWRDEQAEAILAEG